MGVDLGIRVQHGTSCRRQPPFRRRSIEALHDAAGAWRQRTKFKQCSRVSDGDSAHNETRQDNESVNECQCAVREADSLRVG